MTPSFEPTECGEVLDGLAANLSRFDNQVNLAPFHAQHLSKACQRNFARRTAVYVHDRVAGLYASFGCW